MKTGLKALVFALVAMAGLGASSEASAHCGYSVSYYRPAVWHDTSHWDYTPGTFVNHGCHVDYIPGHYSFHRSGHWHVG